MNRYAFVVFGAAFGFLISRAGATTYDYYWALFLFEDLQLGWVIVAAAAVGAVGVRLIEQTQARSLVGDTPIVLRRKAWKGGLIPGALLHGAGWGLAAACPGTVLAMLGEGKLSSIFVITGILLGTYAYGALASREMHA